VGHVVPLHRSAPAAELGDDALAAACTTGDPVARATLFEQHVDAIQRFVARMVHHDAVDDVVQATFLAAYQSIGRFRAGARLRSWLYGIAANLARDHARREGRRVRALAAIGRDEPMVAIDASDRRCLSRLPGALAKLPHELRVPLVLVDLEGQSGREVAAALGIPESTIWRRVFAARERMRELLQGGER
jgi:RNA polymerase sigma-70 factor (ECF subfamily)